MKNGSAVIWIILILVLLPTSLGRLFIDLAGGLIFLGIILTLLISGIAWFGLRSLKSKMKSCEVCGTTYFLEAENCPICGSRNTFESSKIDNNIPASSATIDVEAKESK